MRYAKLSCLLLTLALCASVASAVTYIVPSDRELIQSAPAIVVGKVEAVASRANGRGVETVATVMIDRVLKGQLRAGTQAQVVTIGGAVPGRFIAIPGGPAFKAGERVLLLLQPKGDEWILHEFGLGKFTYIEESGRTILSREVNSSEIFGLDEKGQEHVERVRDAAAYETFIRASVAGNAPVANFFVTAAPNASGNASKIDTQATAIPYVLDFAYPGTGLPARWPTPSFTFESVRTQSGTSASTATAISEALGVWNSDPNSYVAMSYSGNDPSNTYATYPTDDGANSLVFDTPSAEIPSGFESGIGVSFIYGNGNSHVHPVTGETFYDVFEGDVFIKQGISIPNQTFFDQLVAHEVGHALAFTHGPTGALMGQSINGAYGANLQQWDRDAVQTVYGAGPACVPPSINSQPQSQTIASGQQATLSVGASGSSPTYQWYEGTSGSGTPIGGATGSTYTTPALSATTSYWVKVSNTCGNVNSATATVTVSSCPAPVITVQPQSQTIQTGSSATLSVQVTGTGPFSYQWYRQGTPFATGSTIVVSPTSNTQYWVVVTDKCNQSVESDHIMVTVTSNCAPPTINIQPASVTIPPGQKTTLSVVASGSSLQYQWYRGNSGDVSQPIAAATSNTYTTPTATSTISYWVKVYNTCGSVNSATATVTVSACTLPVITQQPASQTITTGGTATLTVVASGSGITYQWYRGNSGDISQPISGATQSTYTTPPLNANAAFWVLVKNSCGGTFSTTALITASCVAPLPPNVQAPANASSGQSYKIEWDTNASISRYEYQESTDPNFAGAQTISTTAHELTVTHTVAAVTRYYFRVRGVAACNGVAGNFTQAVEVVVSPQPSANELIPNAAVPEGSTTPVTFRYLLMPSPASKQASDENFTITTDKPWLTVTPSAGTVPPSGVTLTITAATSGLAGGTNTATMNVSKGGGNSSSTVPISVSMVSPVTPKPKTSPTANSLLIPVVGHLDGSGGSKFLSDLRLANVSNQRIQYELTYTPTQSNGASSKITKIDINSGETKALNDVVANWFGLGTMGESAVGVLQVKPLNSAGKVDDDAINANLSTVGSSRTYNVTSLGTFGQWIPAIPLANFIGTPASGKGGKISLQQVAQNSAYRTNFGIVEGTGQAANVVIRIFNANGQRLNETPMTIGAFQHQQINRYLDSKGVTNLSDGRIEVEVVSGNGLVTAYASVVDNATNDPLLVLPVVAASVSENKYILPGVAHLTNPVANWRTDMRIFNAGIASANATVVFQEFRRADGTLPAPVTKQIVVQPGVVRSDDNAVLTLFGKSNVGGSVQVITPVNSSLVVTGRTYDQKPTGTYGQFIPAVTPSDGVGIADRALQVLQVEESDRFRSHLGLVELTGNPVLVEVSVSAPDLTATPRYEQFLAANEYVQLNQVLKNYLKLPTTYNARLIVKVKGGTGKVAAYASVVDNKTQDPTYVPAQ